MNAIEILKRAFAPYGKMLTQASTFPDTVICPGATRFRVYNADASNSVTVTFTFSDNTTMALTVPAGKDYEINTKIVKSLTKSGSSASFQIAIGVPV